MSSPAPYDLCVVGAGSGGIGAALAASRMGCRVLLVEKGECVGGNVARSGVSNWEPGVGGTGFPFEIYKKLCERPNAVHIGRSGRHCAISVPGQPGYPGGESIPDPSAHYRDTLGRSADPQLSVEEMFGPKSRLRQVVMEPGAYAEVVDSLLREAGAELKLGCGSKQVRMESGKVHAVELEDGSVVEASYFIDATADGLLCRSAGCEMLHGSDSREDFNEPGAPEEASNSINGVTLIYRTEPVETPVSIPAENIPCWWRKSGFPMAVITNCPAGGLMLNMLPTMEGQEFLDLGYAAAREECIRRVHAHWHWLQTGWEEFRSFRLSWIAPALGIREGARVRACVMLTEHDLLAGISRQDHPDIIALADHPMDRHGEGGGCRHLLQPYGVPYRCLLPVGLSNVAIASRAAGFSALAASSCRLSRTMMDLGHAAGVAVAMACPRALSLEAVDTRLLRENLRKQHAWVDWPMPEAVKLHLAS